MESGCGRDCWQSGVNPATLIYGDKTGSKLDEQQKIYKGYYTVAQTNEVYLLMEKRFDSFAALTNEI